MTVDLEDGRDVDLMVDVTGATLYRNWINLLLLLPEGYFCMFNGPFSDGHMNLSIVANRRDLHRMLVRRQGSLPEVIAAALVAVKRMHDTGRWEPDLADLQPRHARQPSRDARGQFVMQPANGRQPVPTETPAKEAVDTTPGFTRDRDLVAYLFYKNGRVTKHELRHVHRIQNPPQAINEAEAQYGFKTRTGDALPNGDVPYTLVGPMPEIAGMLPLFASVDDPDEKVYVLELDLYFCTQCDRHPVYRPQLTVDGEAYFGVCPRHGAANFRKGR